MSDYKQTIQEGPFHMAVQDSEESQIRLGEGGVVGIETMAQDGLKLKRKEGGRE